MMSTFLGQSGGNWRRSRSVSLGCPARRLSFSREDHYWKERKINANIQNKIEFRQQITISEDY